MQIDTKDKRTIINVLFVLVLFYVVVTTVNLFTQSVTSLNYVWKNDALFGVQQIITVVAALVSVVGLGIYIAVFFTEKISLRTVVIVQVLVILVLIVLFIVSAIDDVYPNATTLAHAVNFVILLGICIYQFRDKEIKDNHSPETTGSEK